MNMEQRSDNNRSNLGSCRQHQQHHAVSSFGKIGDDKSSRVAGGKSRRRCSNSFSKLQQCSMSSRITNTTCDLDESNSSLTLEFLVPDCYRDNNNNRSNSSSANRQGSHEKALQMSTSSSQQLLHSSVTSLAKLNMSRSKNLSMIANSSNHSVSATKKGPGKKMYGSPDARRTATTSSSRTSQDLFHASCPGALSLFDEPETSDGALGRTKSSSTFNTADIEWVPNPALDDSYGDSISFGVNEDDSFCNGAQSDNTHCEEQPGGSILTNGSRNSGGDCFGSSARLFSSSVLGRLVEGEDEDRSNRLRAEFQEIEQDNHIDKQLEESIDDLFCVLPKKQNPSPLMTTKELRESMASLAKGKKDKDKTTASMDALKATKKKKKKTSDPSPETVRSSSLSPTKRKKKISSRAGTVGTSTAAAVIPKSSRRGSTGSMNPIVVDSPLKKKKKKKRSESLDRAITAASQAASLSKHREDEHLRRLRSRRSATRQDDDGEAAPEEPEQRRGRSQDRAKKSSSSSKTIAKKERSSSASARRSKCNASGGSRVDEDEGGEHHASCRSSSKSPTKKIKKKLSSSSSPTTKNKRDSSATRKGVGSTSKHDRNTVRFDLSPPTKQKTPLSSKSAAAAKAGKDSKHKDPFGFAPDQPAPSLSFRIRKAGLTPSQLEILGEMGLEIKIAN